MRPEDCPTFNLAPIWLFVEAVARVREERRAARGRPDDFGSGRNNSLLGIAGEIGVALITGQSLTSCLEDGPDAGQDVAEVNVKATGYWPPILKKLELSHWNAEWYALAHVSETHVVTYIGCVSREDFLAHGYRRTWDVSANRGPTVCLDAEDVLRLTLQRRAAS